VRQFIQYVKLIGPQRYEAYFNRSELRFFAKQNIIVNKDPQLLETYYEPIQTYDKQVFKIESDFLNRLRVVGSPRQYSSNLQPFTLETYLCGGSLYYSKNLHLTPKPLPPAIPRSIPVASKHRSTTSLSLSDLQSRLSASFGRRRYHLTRQNLYMLKSLRPLTKVESADIGVFDFETINVDDKVVPFLCGVYTPLDGYKRFENLTLDHKALCKEIVAYILQPRFKNYCFFAHNLMGFDAILLFPAIVDYVVEQYKVPAKEAFSFIQNDTDLISFTVLPSSKQKPDRLNIKFIDSWRFLPMSLDQVGRALCQMRKKPLSFEI